MPVWIEALVSVNAIVAVALLFFVYRLRPSNSASELIDEIAKTLANESSRLRSEVINAITQVSRDTRETLEQFRSSSNERLDGLSKSHTEQGSSLREAVDNTLARLGRDTRDSFGELRKEVQDRLQEVVKQTTALKEDLRLQQNSLRETLEQRLDKLNESNAKKLDEMRETVDEKLHKTLESRLTESFGIVTEHLGKVQSGLGEMKELATGVGDLKRLLTNVRTRGTAGEFAVEMLLVQMLAPNQYQKNVRVKTDTREAVEFAIRIPGENGSEALLPIDSKFPREDWERLEEAQENDDRELAKSLRERLLTTIRREAKKISDLYVNPPTTTNFAILYLATEGLYSEACREPGFLADIQSQFKILIAGPTTLMAILYSLQMGFRTLAIQQKGSEVWNILAAAKTEFGKFGGLMDKVEKQVGTVQNTLQEVGKRTRVINKTLKTVEVLEMSAPAESILELAAEADSGDEA